MHGETDLIEFCLGCPRREFEEVMRRAFETRLNRFGRRIHFYAPGMVHYETPFYKAANPYRFPAVSVTGKFCELQCKHCRGTLLRSMVEVRSPEELYELCRTIKRLSLIHI